MNYATFNAFIKEFYERFLFPRFQEINSKPTSQKSVYLHCSAHILLNLFKCKMKRYIICNVHTTYRYRYMYYYVYYLGTHQVHICRNTHVYYWQRLRIAWCRMCSVSTDWSDKHKFMGYHALLKIGNLIFGKLLNGSTDMYKNSHDTLSAENNTYRLLWHFKNVFSTVRAVCIIK